MLSVMAKPCRPTDGMHCTPPLILFETTKEGVGWCSWGDFLLSHAIHYFRTVVPLSLPLLLLGFGWGHLVEGGSHEFGDWFVCLVAEVS